MAKCCKCGKGGLMGKLSSRGLCMECTEDTLFRAERELEARISVTPKPEGEVSPLKGRITEKFESVSAVKQQLQEYVLKLETVKAEHAILAAEVEALKAQRIVDTEAVEMEAFSLYTPRFKFATSQEYKAALNVLRDQQKNMLRDGTAVVAPTGWTINGSKEAGKKVIADTSKLMLRAFNNECDIAVGEVRFSNFSRCLMRIDKSYETINKLASAQQITISFSYRKLKQNELAMAYAYQCKLQEEREAARVQREQQREAVKVARELEESRKEAEKERKHYLQALEQLRTQVEGCQDEVERAAIQAKQSNIITHLDELTRQMEDIDYRQANQRAGYVYVISNIGSFGPDVYKIGMTRRLDPYERVYELGDASVPFTFDVHAMIFTDDAPALEAALHQAFHEQRVNMVNNRREYFRVPLERIKQVILEHHDRTVEFNDIPEAQQYRESVKLRQGEEYEEIE